METPINQRWRRGRASWRPAGEVIDPRRYAVDLIPDDATAKAFVCRHHYSRSYPAARFRAVLSERGRVVGVAVFSTPTNTRATTNFFHGHRLEHVELGRLVLLDEVPGNAETWFMARAFDLIRREGIRAVLTFADPVPRETDAGLVFGGHVGTIYKAASAVHAGLKGEPDARLGLGTARIHWLLPDGTIYSPRAMSKVRQLDRGAAYGVRRLVEAAEALGRRLDPLDVDEPKVNPADWLRDALRLVGRRLRHPGNLRYLIPLGGRREPGKGIIRPEVVAVPYRTLAKPGLGPG